MHKEPGLMVPMSAIVLAYNTARQVVEEVVELENLIGGSRDVVPLGK